MQLDLGLGLRLLPTLVVVGQKSLFFQLCGTEEGKRAALKP